MGNYDTATTERAEVLKKFLREAGAADLKIDAEFQRILQDAQALLEMSDQEIADALSVSRPTVNRWINGKNLPYNAMRKPVLTWIQEQLTQKLKKVEASTRQVAAASTSSYRDRAVASTGYYDSPAIAAKSR